MSPVPGNTGQKVSGNATHKVSGNSRSGGVSATVAPRGTVHATVITLTIELIGVGLMAALAETGPKMGRAMVTLMGGFMLMWFIVNAGFFASIVNAMRKYS